MRILEGEDVAQANHWLAEAAKVAEGSLCLRVKCGSVVVKNKEVIGKGYNAPPLDNLEYRVCLDENRRSREYSYDHTCCIHAEERAMMDTLKTNPKKMRGSKIYFTRLNESWAKNPYCTVCSRMALDMGIAGFVLKHEDGICEYTTDEYTALSFEYVEKTAQLK